MSNIHGIGVSPGISIGRASVIRKSAGKLSGIRLSGDEAILAEISKFDTAVLVSVAEIEALKLNDTLALVEEDLEILETQIEFLSDPQIKEDVSEKIRAELKNANDAVIEVISALVDVFKNMEDEYMSARSADIQDIGNRILRNLGTSAQQEDRKLEGDTIIIAEDIAPSDTITMDINHVMGFATQIGGKTSHTAILAKSKGIPAVVGCGEALASIQDNDLVILDGTKGFVFVNPAESVLAEYTAKREEFRDKITLLKSLKELPAQTKDGHAVRLMANISNSDDLDEVFENGGAGVGLLRTELLFMGHDALPSEETQYEFYKKIAVKSKGMPVIVRTIDIGGDKQVPYFGLPGEQNPFLGYRAIRICLESKDMFIIQLRAILRASAFGNFKIMFPMISSMQEVRKAKAILQEAKDQLLSENIAFDKHIEVGIMIEIPSAAVMADMLAREVDFFSIGTNDLCQYTLAVDRMNEKVSDLYDPYNPGVLRLIQTVIEQGHKNNIHVGMCGELASDPLATLLLLGMGLQDFSMSSSSIPYIKNSILNTTIEKAEKIYKTVMEMDNSENIIAYLKEVTQ